MTSEVDIERDVNSANNALLSIAEKIQVPVNEIASWSINRIRDDGAIDLYIPREIINVKGVSLDEHNVGYLVDLFNERAEETGGTGQRDPVVLGHVLGRGVFMLDGFHRNEVQRRRGVEYLHATLEIGLTYEDVVRRRLEYARTHPEIEFSRQVAWVQEVWEETKWSKLIPNVLTAFRALEDDYSFGGTEDIEQIDALVDEDFYAIREWVKAKSEEWGYSPKDIRKNLARVEGVDPSIIPLTENRRGKPPEGKIGLSQLDVVRNTFPGEGDLQLAFVALIIENRLNVQACEALANDLIEARVMLAEDIMKVANTIDMKLIGKVSRSVYKKTPNKSSNKGIGSEITEPFTILPGQQARAEQTEIPKTVSEALSRVVSLAEFVLKTANSSSSSDKLDKNNLEQAIRLEELARSIRKAFDRTLTTEQTALIENHAHLVKYIASQLLIQLPSHIQLDDLVANGNLGLIDASTRFDETKSSFITFATNRIRGAILDGIRNSDDIARSDRRIQRAINKILDDYAAKQIPITEDGLAEKLGISVEKLRQHQQTINFSALKPIDDHIADTSDAQSPFSGSAKPFYEPSDFAELVYLNKALKDAIESLPYNESEVIKRYYLKEETLEEIGWDLGVSESRASQIMADAINNLQRLMRNWK